MGTTSEPPPGFASASPHVCRPSEPATGDRLTVRTEQPSGVRSSTTTWSVLTQPARPGPTSSAIGKLARDVDGDPDVVDQFVSDYLRLLDDRMNRLDELLVDPDAAEHIRVLTLSLETTSAMLGGAEVAEAARVLRMAVVDDQPTGPAFEQLVQATHALRRVLTEPDVTTSADLRKQREPGPAGG